MSSLYLASSERNNVLIVCLSNCCLLLECAELILLAITFSKFGCHFLCCRLRQCLLLSVLTFRLCPRLLLAMSPSPMESMEVKRPIPATVHPHPEGPVLLELVRRVLLPSPVILSGTVCLLFALVHIFCLYTLRISFKGIVFMLSRLIFFSFEHKIATA